MKKKYTQLKCKFLFSSALLFGLFMNANAIAQNSYSISGRVLAVDQKIINNAQITIIGTNNSQKFQIQTVDNNGAFNIKIKDAGTYKLSFRAAGMDSTSITVILAETKLVTTPDMLLEYKVKNLNQVNIVAQKPLIELKNNKLVYNVPSTASNGFTALELLKKVPGVVVDGNNNILIKGQSNVKVMINNKMMELGQEEINAILQSKTSSDIDNIEVITNPSSQYDAAGSAGIINFNLKRIKRDSFNGNVSSTFIYGKSPKYNNALTLSYQEKKLSTYATLSVINDDYSRKLTAERIITSGNTQNYFSDNTTGDAKSNMYSFLVGGDYGIGKFGTIGTSLNGNIARNHYDNTTATIIAHNAETADSLLKSVFDTHIRRNNLNYNGFYTYKDDKNHLISASIDYASFDNSEKAFQPNQYYSADGSIPLSSQNVQINNYANINIYAFKVDAELPLLKGKLAVGTKFSEVSTKNNFQYFDLENSSEILNINQSNLFDYHENINAGYINYNKTLKKIDFQLGLRTEETVSKGVLTPVNTLESSTENKRTYYNFFPSGSVNLKIDSINTIAISYGRRIDRPNYQTLNPFESRLSELVYQKGNPNLRPQFTNKFTFSYLLGSHISTSIGYNITHDFLNQVIDTLEGKKIIYLPINLGRLITYYYDLNYSLQLNSSWKTNTYFYISHYNLKGDLENGRIDNSIFSYYFNNSQDYNINKSWSVTFSAYVNGPFYYGTFRNKSVWGVDLGLQKKILHDQGAITFNGINIFNTFVYHSHLDYGGVIQNSTDRNENRLFKLSLSYKFKSGTIASQKNKSGAEDESNRTN